MREREHIVGKFGLISKRMKERRRLVEVRKSTLTEK
jgi:hypothetical protein